MPRTADPCRFPLIAATSRSVVLIFGGSFLLTGLLFAMSRETPGVALVALTGGAWLSLVLAMTLPRLNERAGQELVRRLAQFRHELNAIGDTPSHEMLDQLVVRARQLGLEDEEVVEELEQIRACSEALDLKERLTTGELPTAEPLDPMPPGDVCHFVCAVRFGRRRSDQFGHLVLTSGWLKFRGALDVSVAWSEVTTVRRDGREIVITLRDSRRVLRFSCHSFSEAATGGVIAEHLAESSRVDLGPDAGEHHATL